MWVYPPICIILFIMLFTQKESFNLLLHLLPRAVWNRKMGVVVMCLYLRFELCYCMFYEFPTVFFFSQKSRQIRNYLRNRGNVIALYWKVLSYSCGPMNTSAFITSQQCIAAVKVGSTMSLLLHYCPFCCQLEVWERKINWNVPLH